MTAPLFIKVEAFRLFHSPDHRSCDYVQDHEVTVTLKLNGAEVPALIPTFGNAAMYSVALEVDDKLSVAIQPKTAEVYPVEAAFNYRGEGRFDRDAPTPAAVAGVALPEGFDLLGGVFPSPFTMTIFRGFLPAVLDVSAKVRDTVRAHAGKGKQPWRVFKNDPSFDIIAHLEQPAEAHWIAEPPVEQPGTPPRYELRTVDPQSNLRVFELAGSPKVPGLVLVSLPRDLEPVLFDTDLDKRLSCLLMLRPILGAYYVADKYPYGINYLWDAGLKYMGLLGLDPILQKYPDGSKHSGYRDHPADDDSSLQHVGVPHQVAAGGRRAAVVMPMGFGASFGRFEDADFVHTVLHEIYAWELRTHELQIAPADLGPCAVSGFSSGNQLLATWLDKNKGRRFCDEVVREVYSIDAPIGTHALEQIVDAAEAWSRRGAPGKVIRAYNQAPAHNKLNGFKPEKMPFPRPAYELSIDATRTLVSTPAEWLSAAAAGMDPTFKKRWPGGYGGGDREAHQIINATMFVDALRRSSFPKL
ncbi:MAG TPA: hypothetical protein VFX89_09875 [Gammaproteobacteria bacterium]|nr:hypothetical protein [Gammaproteobacteria bacterium]